MPEKACGSKALDFLFSQDLNIFTAFYLKQSPTISTHVLLYSDRRQLAAENGSFVFTMLYYFAEPRGKGSLLLAEEHKWAKHSVNNLLVKPKDI